MGMKEGTGEGVKKGGKRRLREGGQARREEGRGVEELLAGSTSQGLHRAVQGFGSRSLENSMSLHCSVQLSAVRQANAANFSFQINKNRIPK